MANYRLIFRNASTGDRTSSLSHLGFRVWTQYQLSADDFGVCPALAAKFQGDNDALLAEPEKRIQAEIENLIAVNLCGVFTDGRRRYLYQHDWQDWQRLKHATSTALPPIPAELLEKCSPKTRRLFEEFHPKLQAELPPHARACVAPATADAPADALEGGVGETGNHQPLPRRVSVVDRAGALGLVSPGAWQRQHATHALRDLCCDWVCLPQAVHDEWVRRLTAAGTTPEQAAIDIRAWVADVKARWHASGQVPGDTIFDFWRNEWQRTWGSNRRPPAPGSGLDALIGGGRG